LTLFLIFVHKEKHVHIHHEQKLKKAELEDICVLHQSKAVLKVPNISIFKINIFFFFIVYIPVFRMSLETAAYHEIHTFKQSPSSLCLVACHTISSLVRYYRSTLSLGRLSTKSTHPGSRWRLA